ncbi:MAG: hypothetical protein ACTSSG_13215, partial [Candidatus Heimdallarchaeaceae archaeon]
VGYFAIPGLGLIGIGVVYLTLRTVQLVVMTTISQHYFKVKYGWKFLLSLLLVLLISIGIGIGLYLGVFQAWIGMKIFEIPISPNSVVFLDLGRLISFIFSAILFVGLTLVFKLFTKKDYQFIKNQVKVYLEIRASRNK